MRRLRWLAASVIGLAILFLATGSSASKAPISLSDVKGHWAEADIRWAVQSNLVLGYKDGTFKPDNPVTEAEFLAMLLRIYPNAMNVVHAAARPGVNWTEPFYEAGRRFNLPLLGLEEPAKRTLPANRGLAAKLIAGAYGFHYDAFGSIAFLYEMGFSKGRSGKTLLGYEAGRGMTRAEAVTFLRAVALKPDAKELKVRAEKLAANGATPRYRGIEKIFYGTNGHQSQGGAYAKVSFAEQLKQLKDIGLTIYRNDIWDERTAAQLARMADVFAGSGVQIVPVLTPNPQAENGENEAYDKGYQVGRAAALQLEGRVTYYEVGNELENWVILKGRDGVRPSDYDNARFAKARGALRGMIDGIRSVDVSSRINISGSSWLHLAFVDMLWNGTQPDGATGKPVVRWDTTSWHWYSDMGDITNACGESGCYNVLQELKDRFGKPIWLTEFGVRPTLGDDNRIAEHLVSDRMLGQYASVAKEYDLRSVMVYSFYDDAAYGGDGNYGLLKDDGVTKKPAYSRLKEFIRTHPM